MENRAYKKGEVVYKEGDLQLCLYKVLSGRIGIYTKYDSPEEVVITKIDSGKIFGEMEMLETVPRITTAVSLDDDTVLSIINYDEFGELFRNNPDVIIGVMNALSKRTTHLLNEYREACLVIKELEKERRIDDNHVKSGIRKYISEYMRIQNLSSLFEAETTPLF